MPRTGDIGFMSVRPPVHLSVRACVRASRIWVVLCVRDSAQVASHICTHLVPINCTIIVDVQHTFHFDLDFISDPGQGHNKTLFSCILYIRRVVLCVCDSAQTASHICTHLVPINCTIIVDVQHTFHFDLDLIVFSACFF